VNKGLQSPSISTDADEPTPDADLVSQAQKGSREAFRELFDRYHRRVYAVALGVVRNPDDAQDVVQDAFIKAHRNLSSFRGTSSFYTWVYRIAMNLCIDHTRRMKRRRKVDFDDVAESLEQGSENVRDDTLLPRILGQDPGRSLMRKEIREQIGRALDSLSDNHRAVLVMREMEGLSYDEMAKVMGCSKGTIMSRLFHARKKMQSELREFAGRPSNETEES